MITWTITYPADTLKTRMMSQVGGARANVFSILLGIIRQHGILYLYRGLHIQLLRAFPTCAT